jgi:hypothetical protein
LPRAQRAILGVPHPDQQNRNNAHAAHANKQQTNKASDQTNKRDLTNKVDHVMRFNFEMFVWS